MVGEMRDIETMQIAVAAAETGHLVLSTVHSPDVTSTVARVADSFRRNGRTRFARRCRSALRRC